MRPLTVRQSAEAARHASRLLAPLSAEQRNAALEAMAVALEAARRDLLHANEADLAAAHALPKRQALSPATLARLRLDNAKLDEMIAQVRSVAVLPDPLGRTLDAMELDDRDPDAFATSVDAGASSTSQPGLHLQKISVPLGVLAVIFEARPDAVTQIASLAIKSGNAVILKPGSEVEQTAEALVRALRSGLAAAGLPSEAIALVHGRAQAAKLLKLHGLVDLIIPRGSKALVEYVFAHTRIPVLGHAEGVCHIYVDKDAQLNQALHVIEDAKTDYPAACNAVETVLVHRDIAKRFLPRLARRMHKRGVKLHCCESTREVLLAAEFGEMPAIFDWHLEYGDLQMSVGVVESLDDAIGHIHAHGSSHTESIVTENAEAAERFLREVDAAGVFHNASTRFADGFRYGFGAEVGVSTSKFHARGPVGLEGLTTYKYVLRGHGHIAGDYRGKKARAFTHRREAAQA